MKAYLEIEMPKNCNGCPLHFYEGQGICSCCVLPTIEDDEILKPWKNRRKDCPLKAVPEHGRLIDADAMIRDIERAIVPSRYIKERNADMVNFLSLEDTIIPADGKDTDVPTREEGE